VRINGSNTVRQIVVDKQSQGIAVRKGLKVDLKICPEMAELTIE